MRVSVICTVLNEGDSIRRLLDSLAAQTRLPEEVVVVDGGSSDNTVAVVNGYADRLPMRVLVEPGANISRGRNVAIRAASGDVIASTDAGVWLEPDWLAALLAPFEAPSPAPPQTVAGFFVPDATSPFELAMGATVLPDVADIDPATFLPSSRSVAFRKPAWEAAGGYPEWLDYCEDLIFDLRLREKTGPFAWAPTAVAHFRPRGSLKAFLKQYYRYARGDGKADLWRLRHVIRYATYLIGLPALVLLSVLFHPVWLVVMAAGVWAYCRTPFRRLRPRLARLAPEDKFRAILFVPLIRAVGDLAKMLGYPVGWVWRLRHWRDPAVHWRRDV